MLERFPTKALDDLRTTVSGSVLMPGDGGYAAARAVWNGMINRKPAAILVCETISDIVAGVRMASSQGLAVSIRAGGHNVAGHAVGDGALMLDLSRMRRVVVDPAERTAWVEGGALWADVDAATQAHGLATPGGLISETGVGGLTRSVGIGWLRSRYGLSVDNLIAADVVLASGEVLRTSAADFPDLFWALRGGGGNFGVVARFCFALHPVGPDVMFCAPVYDAADGPGPIRFWRDFIKDKCDDVGSILEFSTVPDSDDFPAKYRGTRCYTIGCVYAGDAEEGQQLLDPLRHLGPLVMDYSGIIPYVDLQKMFDPLFPAGQYRCYWKSHFMSELTDEMIDEALGNAVATPSDRSISSIWNFGGATARVPASATAFGDRSFGWMYSLDSVWERPEDDARVRDWTRAAWTRFRRHAHEGRLYLNFAGQDDDSAQLTRDAFGEHFSRLAEIKKNYDPTNMFRFNQNIQPQQ